MSFPAVMELVNERGNSQERGKLPPEHGEIRPHVGESVTNPTTVPPSITKSDPDVVLPLRFQHSPRPPYFQNVQPARQRIGVQLVAILEEIQA